ELDRDVVHRLHDRQTAAARSQIRRAGDKSETEIALHAELPARVVRRLAIRLVDRPQILTELALQAQRGSDRLDELAARNRVRQIRAGEREAVVVARDDPRRLRESRLIDVVEEVVVREEPHAAADDHLLGDRVFGRAARQELQLRVVHWAVGEEQAARYAEVLHRNL